MAQAPATHDIHLRGDRFKPLTWDTMTPEQQAMAEHLLSGERGGMNGPFNVMLRSPEMSGNACTVTGEGGTPTKHSVPVGRSAWM